MKHDGWLAFGLRAAGLLWAAEAVLAVIDGAWTVAGIAVALSIACVVAVALAARI